MSDPDTSIETLVAGLVDRVRNLLLALDRQDRLETAGAFVGWLEEQKPEDLGAAAREMLLRAMRRAGDPLSYSLLRRLSSLAGSDELEGLSLDRLMEATGLGRVAVSERVYDLVQVGLLSRELTSDQVRLTPLGAAAVKLVEGVVECSGGALAEQLQDQPRPGDKRNESR